MTSSPVRSRSASRLLLALAMTTLACNAGDPDAASKDDARKTAGKADDSTDVCEENGWYDDDVCDLFCPLPDPDCDDDSGDQCADNGWYDDGVCDTFCPKPDPDCGGGGGGTCANDDSCAFDGDGECDDGGPGSKTSACGLGTDITDCGFRSGGECGDDDTSSCANDDSCVFDGDGECDDGGAGSNTSACGLGTDITDCGFRSGAECGDDTSSCANDNSCAFDDDGECDDGGPGSKTQACGLGTDLTDCGFRSGSICEI